MAIRSRIRTQMRKDHLDEALAHLALDGWTVDQVHDWSCELGYTFSRSAWGRFAKEFMAGWEESQVTSLRARAFAQEFGGNAGFEVSDLVGHLLKKRSLQVLEMMPHDDESAVEKLHKLAQAVSTVTRTGVQVEKLRQTWSKAKLEAYSEVEAEFRAGFAATYPEAWEKFQLWLTERASAERATAEAA